MADSTRGRRQRRRREDLLQVASDLLMERGAEGFSLRELARRTDYTPGALYNFFPGKQGLLDELTGRVFERFEEYLAAVPRDVPATERLTLLSDAYARFAAENPEEYLLVFTRIPAASTMRFDDPDAVPAPWGHLVDAFREGATAGELRAASDAEARVLFFEFFALHHGLAMLRLTRMKALPDETFEPLSHAVRSTFVAGLLRPTTTPFPASRPGHTSQGSSRQDHTEEQS